MMRKLSLMRMLLALVTLALPVAATPPTYCRNLTHSPQHPGLEGCLSFISLSPSSIHLFFTGYFESLVGWQSLGAGTGMADALMFVFYPAANASGLTVSARRVPPASVGTKAGHAPPVLDADVQAKVRVLQNERLAEGELAGLFVTELVCEECLDGRDGQAPMEWIWAANKGEKIDGGEVDAPLHFHDDAFARLRLEFIGGGNEFDAVRPPLQRVSSGVVEVDGHGGEVSGGGEPKEGKGHAHQHSVWILWHGFLMAIGWLLVLPAGALAIRFAKHGFGRHWTIQMIGGGVVGTAAALALSVVLEHHSILRIFTKPHHLIGSAATLALVAQSVLGYRHHQIFVRSHKRTAISDWHIYLGRGALVVGVGNTAYGAILSGNVAGPWTVGISVAVVAALWLAAYVWLSRQRDYATVSDGAGGRDIAYEMVSSPKEDE